jgi:hypothetical protein
MGHKSKVTSEHWIFNYLLAFLFLPLVFMSCAEMPLNFKKSDAYDYPIKPGTPEWRAFTNHDEMLKACQVPEITLNKMSTTGLVETVLTYPLYEDWLAYNYPQQGFDAIETQFNGIRELLNRKDAGEKLLERYKTMDPAAIGKDWSSEKRGFYSMSFQNIEILLAQDSILTNLSETQHNDLIKQGLIKIQAKQQNQSIYGINGLESSAWVISKALKQAKFETFLQKFQTDEDLQRFLDTGSFLSDTDLNQILSQAQQYLNEK